MGLNPGHSDPIPKSSREPPFGTGRGRKVHTGKEDHPASGLLRLQWELAREINGGAEPTAMLENALDIAGGLPGVDGLWVWFLDAECGNMVLRHLRGIDPDTAEHLALLPHDSALCSRLILGNEVVEDWQDAWEEQVNLLRRAGWSDVGVWPLVSGETTIGALGAAAWSGGRLDPAAQLVLRTLALQLGGLVSTARLEADLRNSRYNLSQLFQNFRDYVFIAQASGQILYSNVDDCRQLDLGGGSPVGRHLEDYLPGCTGQMGPGGFPAGEESVSWTGRLRAADGRLLPVEVRAFEGRWDQAAVRYYLCRDVSHLTAMEKERARLITAIEQSDDSILITNSAGVIQYANQAFTRLTGYSREEVVGAGPSLLKSGYHKPDFYRNMWATLARGETWKGRIVNRKKNGERFTESATISPVRDPNGIITHYVAVKRDMTTEVALENRLRQSQKMEAIGTLAGGLAHDFNNILYALLGYCQLAMDDVPSDHPVWHSLEEIRKAGTRASNLVAKMLTLGCRSEADHIVVDLRPIVQEALDLARASLPTTIEFEVELEDSGCGVKCDPTQIHQVVLNLCTNAEHAMRAAGGRLTVRLEQVNLGRQDLDDLPNLSPGKHMRLTIADTGTGMDAPTLERIFEPYFTTKNPHEGTGLGLATVQGIVQNHEGRIFVDSHPGEGTTFSLYFPVSLGEAVGREETEAPARRVSGGGRVMVVDDERMIVELAAKALTKMGFTVSAYTDGLKALADFSQDPDQVDVVVTDQTMPRLTGFELAAKLLNIRPGLPIIMTTGYSEQLRNVDLAGSGISVLLSKPLKLAKLAEAVSDLIQANSFKIEV